jgi:hypothetical protein
MKASGQPPLYFCDAEKRITRSPPPATSNIHRTPFCCCSRRQEQGHEGGRPNLSGGGEPNAQSPPGTPFCCCSRRQEQGHEGGRPNLSGGGEPNAQSPPGTPFCCCSRRQEQGHEGGQGGLRRAENRRVWCIGASCFVQSPFLLYRPIVAQLTRPLLLLPSSPTPLRPRPLQPRPLPLAFSRCAGLDSM